jgi:hypothetical protein
MEGKHPCKPGDGPSGTSHGSSCGPPRRVLGALGGDGIGFPRLLGGCQLRF